MSINAVDYILNHYEYDNMLDCIPKIKNITVILSTSRAGSSLFKYILSKHKDVIALDGEEEPYYVLSKNGFPYSDSDSFYNIRNIDLVRNLILNELGIIKNKIDPVRFKRLWKNRLLIQFSTNWARLYDKVSKIIDEHADEDYEVINDKILDSFGRVAGYYDNRDNVPFKIKSNKIEEPPYVVPKYKEKLREEDLTKTLLFKTPQDAYRLGIFEKLFPYANIKYIYLKRNFASTISGLMDGWKSNNGFFAHYMKKHDVSLNIKGNPDNEWWKFDLPKNWREYTNSNLIDVCVNQWCSAHEAIVNSGFDKLEVKFEDFLKDKNETLKMCCDYMGFDEALEVNRALPYIMITDRPKFYKWHKRKEDILNLRNNKRIQDLMYKLNYNINNEDEWI